MNDRWRFRVWDKAENKYNGFSFHLAMSGELDRLSVDGELREADEERFIVERCTGLEDKNGKLLYEGDVVLALESWSGRKREFNVIYCDKEYGFLFVDGFKNTKALFAFIPEDLEVIGNIHEVKNEQ